MDEIERIATEVFDQHVEQIRLFTDRIAQLEASNKKLREALSSAINFIEMAAPNWVVLPSLKKPLEE